MEDARFETMLQKVCVEIADRDLESARRVAPRRRKALRVMVAAAACVALFATGVAAVWPQLRLNRTGANDFSLGADGVGKAQTPAVMGIEFGYLPEGYTVSEAEVDPEGNWASSTIETPDGKKIWVDKYALSYTNNYRFQGTSEEVPEGIGPAETVMGFFTLLSSESEVTPEAVQSSDFLAYPTSDYYYVVCHIGADAADTYEILKNMN